MTRPPANETADPPTGRSFVRRLLWALPLHVLSAVVLLGGAALAYSLILPDHGLFAVVGSGVLTVVMILLAAIGGILAGVLYAARRVVMQAEEITRGLLHTLPPLTSSKTDDRRPLRALRDEYRQVADHSATQVARRLRLPRWMERLVRAVLRGAVVDRFIASCQARGLTAVPPQEFRNWLFAEGVGVGFMLLSDQLWWWRAIVLGFLGLLLGLIALLYVTTT